jgi:hypothetical protein
MDVPLNFRKNYLNEITAIEIGLKKVTRQFVAKEDISSYLKFIKARGLQYFFWQDKNYFYISNFKELAEKAMKIEKKISEMNLNNLNLLEFSSLNKELGKLFGYPKCCIGSFINFTNSQREPNYIFNSYKNTKNPKISFLLNNISVYRLISHFPCSYECRESLDFAAKLFKNLSKEQKRWTEEALKRDILVWNEEKMIGFDERFTSNIVNYNPEKINLLGIPKEMKNALKKGNKLKNSKYYIKIFWEDELIFEYKKKSLEECFVICFY